MITAVIGSRAVPEDFYDCLCGCVPANCTEIVSGGAEGIDALAERYCEKNGLKIKILEPDYGKYGKNAPLRRNEEIIGYADYVIAFWDGLSRGTAFIIAKCIENSVPVRVIIF